MTYSIGFRAPSRHELITSFADDLVAEMEDDDRYVDPGLPSQANPGEISADALAALHQMVTEKLADRNAFAKWFGEYTSAPKYPEVDWTPEEPAEAGDLRLWIANGEPLTRNPASRFSFTRAESGAVLLFVDGESFETAGEAAVCAELLCAQDGMVVDIGLTQSEATMALLVQLYNQGSIAFDQED